jgi:hypothetical protein
MSCRAFVADPLVRKPKGALVIVISVLTRRLREGKTYEDFHEAWLPDHGFGFPTRVVSALRVDDDREVITIGFSESTKPRREPSSSAAVRRSIVATTGSMPWSRPI